MNRRLFYKKVEKILINKIKLSTNDELNEIFYFISNLQDKRLKRVNDQKIIAKQHK